MFISYSHDSEDHRKAVLRLAHRLQKAGLDVGFDRFVEHEPPASWPSWMRQELNRADFVLLVVTEVYRKRFLGESVVDRGFGVRWEGTLIASELYYTTSEKARFLPVVLRAEDRPLIPSPLDQTSWFVIGESADADIAELLRVLRREPLAGVHRGADPVGWFDGITPALEIGETIGDGDLAAIEDALPHLRGPQWARAVHFAGVLHRQRGELMQAITCFTRVRETTLHAHLHQAATDQLASLLPEFDAHYGEQGPVAAARAWLECLGRGEDREAWKRLDRNLRLALAQEWISANQAHPEVSRHGRDVLAAALAQPEPTHTLAEHLLSGKLAALRSHYAEWDADTWGAASTPRRIGVDYEVVLMAAADDGILVADEQPLRTFPLLLRRVGPEWLVANFRVAYVIPGWPPRHGDIPPSAVRDTQGSTEGEGNGHGG
ncbi:hypothetical protein AQJ91_23045 [Streptomyces dysideae]|uniref:SEFIR domain-containing protein n=1 Tax=Streptomyces dysideae TaxID=909626 RepID=A0A124IEM3_9ACTN|nr:hypothetical protein AQJ91_23045 [Streptomyces dysideae]